MTTKYEVTGVDVYGKRFIIRTDNYYHAMGINLWRGTVWEVNEPGQGPRRSAIKSVYN